MSAKYQWPSSALNQEDMHLLYKKSLDLNKPITALIKEAVEIYLKEED